MQSNNFEINFLKRNASQLSNEETEISPKFEELSLGKQSNPVKLSKIESSWVHVPEFVPQASNEYINKPQTTKSWANVLNPKSSFELTLNDAESQLCPYGANGVCRYGENCLYIHGDLCDMCFKTVLHPFHQGQRKKHEQKCLKQHEEEMKIAFAMAKSKDKVCGICMEIVVEKSRNEARFGILPNCNHCFCLKCLRQWRQSKFELKIIRSCPECRQTSDFVCPSRYWVDTKEEKFFLLNNYKSALKKKECKYYNKGLGQCPFGNKCFYQHFDSNGKHVDVGPPQKRNRTLYGNSDSEEYNEVLLLDFFNERIESSEELFYLLDLL